MVISQGAQANLNGKVFENMMLPLFQANGFKVFRQAELKKVKTPNISRYVIRNAPYTTIYGEVGRTEFLIVDKNRHVRVEAKYQASQGSVDEKYPYMLLNGIYAYPEKEIIFVIDGGGYKPGALKWLKKSIENNWLDFKGNDKDIKLMNIAEFLNWFNHEFSD